MTLILDHPSPANVIFLPRGFDHIDQALRIKRRLEPQEWQALEALAVCLVSHTPSLIRNAGELQGLQAHHLDHPKHRHLLEAIHRLEAQGDYSYPLPLDLLGSALIAAGSNNPASDLEYLQALAAIYPSRLGINVAQIWLLLEARYATKLKLEALQREADALGYTDYAQYTKPSNEAGLPAECLSYTYRDTYTQKCDIPTALASTEARLAISTGSPDQARGATQSGEAAERRQPAVVSALADIDLGGTRLPSQPLLVAKLAYCPNPIRIARHRNSTATLSIEPMRCARKSCPTCGAHRAQEHLQNPHRYLRGNAAWRVTVPAAKWGAARKQLSRKGCEYKKIPTADGAYTIWASSEALGGERVENPIPLIEQDICAALTLKGNISSSKGWKRPARQGSEAQDHKQNIKALNLLLGALGLPLQEVESVVLGVLRTELAWARKVLERSHVVTVATGDSGKAPQVEARQTLEVSNIERSAASELMLGGGAPLAIHVEGVREARRVEKATRARRAQAPIEAPPSSIELGVLVERLSA
jgi:hypothetical protein